MIIYDINLDHRADRREQISNWLFYRPKFGLQRPGFSDIEGGYVDYGV